MTDEQIRAHVQAAHRGEAPPPVSAIRERRPRRPRRPYLPLALAAAAVACVLFLRGDRRPPPPSPPLATLRLETHAPLDFLLRTPGADLLDTTPRFDTKGWMP